MTTWTALTTLTGKAAAEALGEGLEQLTPEPTGVGVFEVEDGSGLWEVGGYFTEKPDLGGLALLENLHGARPFAVSKLDDVDWVAQVKRELTPVEAGRFVVHGAHDRDVIPSQKISLEIEAAMAFGTGHHGTTQGCLMAFDALLHAGLTARNVADIGSGTAVLAMAAVAAMPARAIASDIDPVATMTARANTMWNGHGARVQCVTAPGFRHPVLRARAPYDLVFANILAAPLKRLAPQMAAHTESGSIVILSGILNRQARGVEGVYEGHGFSIAARRQIGEWTTLTLRRT
ncbi:MAG: 50S ribosomal protein L11 methyltransferase [Pseudomonadota bacterium]